MQYLGNLVPYYMTEKNASLLLAKSGPIDR